VDRRGAARCSRPLLPVVYVRLNALPSCHISAYVCSISRLLDKTNTFHCTHFIEEGCLTLRQRAEYQTDKDLYHVIRLQRIIEKIDTLANPAYSDHEAQAAYLRILAELEEFRTQLLSEVTDSRESLSPFSLVVSLTNRTV
jgi:hypothetical protein